MQGLDSFDPGGEFIDGVVILGGEGLLDGGFEPVLGRAEGVDCGLSVVRDGKMRYACLYANISFAVLYCVVFRRDGCPKQT